MKPKKIRLPVLRSQSCCLWEDRPVK